MTELPHSHYALVAVWQSAGFSIGRLRVRISARATSHQGLYGRILCQMDTDEPSIPLGSVNEYQLSESGQDMGLSRRRKKILLSTLITVQAVFRTVCPHIHGPKIRECWDAGLTDPL